MNHRHDDTPKGTTRIPAANDFIKMRVATLAVVVVLLVGGTAWATKMNFDMAQVKTDIAAIKASLHLAVAQSEHP